MSATLEGIQARLDGADWNTETFDTVAQLLRDAGYEVRGPAEDGVELPPPARPMLVVEHGHHFDSYETAYLLAGLRALQQVYDGCNGDIPDDLRLILDDAQPDDEEISWWGGELPSEVDALCEKVNTDADEPVNAKLLEACEQAEYWLAQDKGDCVPTEMLRVLRAAIADAKGEAVPS